VLVPWVAGQREHFEAEHDVAVVEPLVYRVRVLRCYLQMVFDGSLLAGVILHTILLAIVFIRSVRRSINATVSQELVRCTEFFSQPRNLCVRSRLGGLPQLD